jgi:hypothetical protein
VCLPEDFFQSSLVNFSRGEWVDLSFGIEEHRVFTYYVGQLFVRIRLDYHDIALMTYEMIRNLDSLLLFQLVKILEMSWEQLSPTSKAICLAFEMIKNFISDQLFTLGPTI